MRTLFRILFIVVYFLLISSTLLYSADFFGDALKKGLPQLPEFGGSPTGRAAGAGLDDRTIASGL
ncbi:MAG: hypothetical protein ACXWL9_07105, partial [Syntrophales bacterium]